MDKNEILKMAKQENNSKRGDEREVKIYDKSFYWAFVAILLSAFVFTLIQKTKGIIDHDNMCIISYAAVAALVYRYIKNRRKVELILVVCCLIGAIGSTVTFIKGL
ncbi:MAG: DUF6442 family protein [Ruminococcus sp.]|nr:DUF6442 family protein [Ruminococcus sp.]